MRLLLLLPSLTQLSGVTSLSEAHRIELAIALVVLTLSKMRSSALLLRTSHLSLLLALLLRHWNAVIDVFIHSPVRSGLDHSRLPQRRRRHRRLSPSDAGQRCPTIRSAAGR